MRERRYNEEEIAAIFEEASQAQHLGRGQLPSGEGMTLAQLQEIGQEVGIAPQLVAEAASAIDRGGRPATRSFLGFPIGVGRTVDLNRTISDEEWERLVVDLRETFDARGKVSYDGPFRQWTNGNLQALLEPTPTGHRLRLQTVKGDAQGLMIGGLALLGGAAATLISMIVAGKLTDWGGVIFLTTMGLGMFGVAALRLPGWARQRRRQMEGIASRLALSVQSEPIEDPTA